MADDKDLASFLQKVDDIGSLITDLSSTDEGTRKEATEKADSYLEKVDPKLPEKKKGVDRTVINHAAFKDEGPAAGPPIHSEMGQDSFVSAMQQDADERAERRKQRHEEGNKLKDIGNEHFRAGRFEEAVELYTQGIEKAKDITVLYTNRAQAYLRLQQYEKTLEDCEWALRVFENCLKAFVYQGKAYLGLGQYDKAIESYQRALKADPKKEKLIKDYISEVELARTSAEQEKHAKSVFEAGDPVAQGVVHLLKRLDQADQLPLYYSGGLRIISDALVNIDQRTLFRTNDGFKLLTEHQLISRCIKACPRSLSRDELDVCKALLDTYRAACVNNEENQKQVMSLPDLGSKLMRYIDSRDKAVRAVRASSVLLLQQASETPAGRATIVTNFDLPRLIASLFTLLHSKSSVSVNAVSLLNNLALDSKFKSEMRSNLEETVLPAFEGLLNKALSESNQVLPHCITTMTNLCGDDRIRHRMANRTASWSACVTALDKHSTKLTETISIDIVHATLGLLMNLSHQTSSALLENAVAVCKRCCPLVACEETRADVRLRGVTVLSHVVPHCGDSAQYVSEYSTLLQSLIQLLKNSDIEMQRPAMKCLAGITYHVTEARTVAAKTAVKSMLQLLKVQDEITVGNAALCLSHCLDNPDLAPKLADKYPDLIQDLLVVARDAHKHDTQHNSSILIAKLAQSDARHLDKLRELDGLGILHDVLRHHKE